MRQLSKVGCSPIHFLGVLQRHERRVDHRTARIENAKLVWNEVVRSQGIPQIELQASPQVVVTDEVLHELHGRLRAFGNKVWKTVSECPEEIGVAEVVHSKYEVGLAAIL